MTFLLPVPISEGGILNIRADIYMREKQDYRYTTIRGLIRGNAEEASTMMTYFSSHRPFYKVYLTTRPFQAAIAQGSLVFLHLHLKA
jgi:hypothetical protein